MAEKVMKSDCMLCVWDCGIKAYLEDDKLVKVEGLPEHPVSKGYICPRGEALPEYVYSPTRLKKPLLRKNGELQEVSWDEALDFCANKLTQIKEKYGARALAAFCGSVGVENIEIGNFAQRFLGAFGSPNLLSVENICYRTRIIARQLTFGRYPLDDPQKSKCIILWGHNPDGAKGMLAEWIREKLEKENDFRLILIDPRKTPLAEHGYYVAIRPGTDAALALAMLNVIINENLYDKETVENYSVGFEELVKHVQGYTPEWAEEITWISSEDIKEIARIFATSESASIVQGVNSLDQHRNGLQNSRVLSLLQAVTGNVFNPGGWVTVPRPPLANLGVNVDEEPLGSGQYPVFSSLWGRKSPFGIATMYPDAVLQGDPYPVRGTIVTAANPVLSFPDSNLYQKAFENLDFLAVMDPFLTETAKLADVVLPACTFLEKSGVSYVYGVVFGEPYAMVHRKVIEPVGESKPDWKIWSELAERMGLGEYFPWKEEDEVVDAMLETGEFAEKLKQSELGLFYGEKQYNYLTKKQLKTPSGKIEIYSKTLEEHGHDPIPKYIEPAQSPVSTPELYEKYPIILISGARMQEFTHTQQRNVPSLLEQNPEPLVEVHPDTAGQYGVSDGDMINVETRKGSIQLKAQCTDRISRGVVSIAHGWSDANVNKLMDLEGYDPITAYPDFKSVLCRISPAR